MTVTKEEFSRKMQRALLDRKEAKRQAEFHKRCVVDGYFRDRRNRMRKAGNC